LVLVGAIVTVWALCSLAVNIFSASLFALILARLFLATGPAAQLSLPTRFHNELEIEGKRFQVSWAMLIGALALAVMLASGLAYMLMKDTWTVGQCWCSRIAAHRRRDRRTRWPRSGVRERSMRISLS